MMWSGLDYYGSDVGGFHRGALGVYPGYHDDAMDELYTQWLAYSAMFEVPVRPHTENLCNCKETAPDRIGDLASNRANLALRYAAPAVLLLAGLRGLARGRAGVSVGRLLVPRGGRGARARPREDDRQRAALGGASRSSARRRSRSICPAGDWYVFRTGATVISTGETFTFPVHEEGRFQLPLFARDGAIVPAEGGVLNVFGTAPNVFEWYDDDGVSTAYRSGDFDLDPRLRRRQPAHDPARRGFRHCTQDPALDATRFHAGGLGDDQRHGSLLHPGRTGWSRSTCRRSATGLSSKCARRLCG